MQLRVSLASIFLALATLAAQAQTPKEIVKRIFDVTSAVIAQPAVGKALEKEGTETSGSKSPEDFAAFIAEDAKLWARLVKESGAKAD